MELRVIGQHVTGQYQESDSVLGAQSWSTAEIDFPDFPSFRGAVLVSSGKKVDVWGSQNNLRGLVHSLPCSRAAQICRKTVRTWISLTKNRMVDDEKDQRTEPRNGCSGARRGRSGGRRHLGGEIVVVGSVRKSSSSSLSSSPSRRKRRGNSRRSRKRRNCRRSVMAAVFVSAKRSPRRRRGHFSSQEQSEVVAKVMKEQFDQAA